jgi:hypothetical protein
LTPEQYIHLTDYALEETVTKSQARTIQRVVQASADDCLALETKEIVRKLAPPSSTIGEEARKTCQLRASVCYWRSN